MFLYITFKKKYIYINNNNINKDNLKNNINKLCKTNIDRLSKIDIRDN